MSLDGTELIPGTVLIPPLRPREWWEPVGKCQQCFRDVYQTDAYACPRSSCPLTPKAC